MAQMLKSDTAQRFLRVQKGKKTFKCCQLSPMPKVSMQHAEARRTAVAIGPISSVKCWLGPGLVNICHGHAGRP